MGMPTYNITDKMKTSKQLDGLLEADNDYIKRARKSGQSYAQSRGLLNSDIAAGAAHSAAIDAALPIAQADAGVEADFGKIKYQGDVQSTLNSQEFGFQTQLNAQNFGFQKDLNSQNFGFQSKLNDQNYGHQTGLLEMEQGFNKDQSALDRAHQLSLSDKQFGQQESLLDKEQAFSANQNLQNREHQSSLLEIEQDFSAGQNLQNRNHQTGLLEQEQAFNADQSSLDRTQRQDLLAQEQAFNAEQNADQRSYEERMRNIEDATQREIEATKQDAGLYAQYIKGVADINASSMEQGEKDVAARNLWDQYTAGSQIGNSLRHISVNPDGTVNRSEAAAVKPQAAAGQPPAQAQPNTTAMLYGQGIYTSGITRDSAGELVDKNGNPSPGGDYDLVDGQWKRQSQIYGGYWDTVGGR
ncbi:hypothetical protein [Pontibacterium sp.]|uniref:hypothetical protein n=1 Tax=Pontibacterium sp. TaxID=2036026 RepID=UPI00356AFBFE